MARYVKDRKVARVFAPGVGRVLAGQIIEGDYDSVPGLVKLDPEASPIDILIAAAGPPHDMIDLKCRCGNPSSWESGWCGTDFCVGEPGPSEEEVATLIKETLEGPTTIVGIDKLGDFLKGKPTVTERAPKEQPKKKGRPPKAK